MSIPLLACMATAAAFYHLPPRVLPSIQAVEGGYIGAVHADSDGSQDLGIMQVNTRWLADLAQVARLSDSDVRQRLIYDGCFNIAAAAAIMRAYLNEAHGDLMLAVGYYHSHTPALNLQYQSKVLASAARLFGTGNRTMPHATHADANN
jgi:Transglycosylase SLT domain